MKQYFITANGKQAGPYIHSQLDSMWKSGLITADAIYWTDGMAAGRSILELFASDDEPASTTGTSPQDNTNKPPTGPARDRITQKRIPEKLAKSFKQGFVALMNWMSRINSPPLTPVHRDQMPLINLITFLKGFWRLSPVVKATLICGAVCIFAYGFINPTLAVSVIVVIIVLGSVIWVGIVITYHLHRRGPTTSTSPPPPRADGAEFTFACANCGQHISASLDQVGTTSSCPSCGKPIVVPNPDDNSPPIKGIPQTSEPKSSSGQSVTRFTVTPEQLGTIAAYAIGGILGVIIANWITSHLFNHSTVETSTSTPVAQNAVHAPARADPIIITTFNTVDERLFLLRLLNAINCSRPDENLAPDKLQHALDGWRSEAVRIQEYLRDKALDERLTANYVMLVSTIDAYREYLVSIGRVEGEALTQKTEDSLETGFDAGSNGVDAWFKVSDSGGSTKDALIAAGINTLLTGLADYIQKDQARDEAKHEATAEAQSQYHNAVTQYITYCQNTASLLSDKYGWQNGEAGFEESPEYDSTVTTMIQNGDVDGLVQLDDTLIAKRPRDPFVIRDRAFLNSFDATRSVADRVADANSCITAAYLVPAGAIYDEYRAWLLDVAGNILIHASTREIGNNAWGTAFNQNAALAVQVWNACLKFTPDVTGEIREHKAWALFLAGDLDAAREQVSSIEALRKDDLQFAYNMACLTSDSGDFESSLRWFDHAIRQLGWDNIVQSKKDPDLATLRAKEASTFADLTTVSLTFKVNPGLFNDDLDVTNNSPFALSDVVVKGEIMSNGRSWPMELNADVIKAGETYVWKNALSIPNNTAADTSVVQVASL